MKNKWKCIVGGLMVLPPISLVIFFLFLLFKSVGWLLGTIILFVIVGFGFLLDYTLNKGIDLIEDCLKQNKRATK